MTAHFASARFTTNLLKQSHLCIQANQEIRGSANVAQRKASETEALMTQGGVVRLIILAVLLFTAVSIQAQQNSTSPASPVPKVDSPQRMGPSYRKVCGAFKAFPCAEVLFTGKPVTLRLGSIAPQNGFGAGLAYVGYKTTENWRTTWNSDAIALINGSWRAGLIPKTG